MVQACSILCTSINYVQPRAISRIPVLALLKLRPPSRDPSVSRKRNKLQKQPSQRSIHMASRKIPSATKNCSEPVVPEPMLKSTSLTAFNAKPSEPSIGSSPNMRQAEDLANEYSLGSGRNFAAVLRPRSISQLPRTKTPVSEPRRAISMRHREPPLRISAPLEVSRYENTKAYMALPECNSTLEPSTRHSPCNPVSGLESIWDYSSLPMGSRLSACRDCRSSILKKEAAKRPVSSQMSEASEAASPRGDSMACSMQDLPAELIRRRKIILAGAQERRASRPTSGVGYGLGASASVDKIVFSSPQMLESSTPPLPNDFRWLKFRDKSTTSSRASCRSVLYEYLSEEPNRLTSDHVQSGEETSENVSKQTGGRESRYPAGEACEVLSTPGKQREVRHARIDTLFQGQDSEDDAKSQASISQSLAARYISLGETLQEPITDRRISLPSEFESQTEKILRRKKDLSAYVYESPRTSSLSTTTTTVTTAKESPAESLEAPYLGATIRPRSKSGDKSYPKSTVKNIEVVSPKPLLRTSGSSGMWLSGKGYSDILEESATDAGFILPSSVENYRGLGSKRIFVPPSPSPEQGVSPTGEIQGRDWPNPKPLSSGSPPTILRKISGDEVSRLFESDRVQERSALESQPTSEPFPELSGHERLFQGTMESLVRLRSNTAPYKHVIDGSSQEDLLSSSSISSFVSNLDTSSSTSIIPNSNPGYVAERVSSSNEAFRSHLLTTSRAQCDIGPIHISYQDPDPPSRCTTRHEYLHDRIADTEDGVQALTRIPSDQHAQALLRLPSTLHDIEKPNQDFSFEKPRKSSAGTVGSSGSRAYSSRFCEMLEPEYGTGPESYGMASSCAERYHSFDKDLASHEQSTPSPNTVPARTSTQQPDSESTITPTNNNNVTNSWQTRESRWTPSVPARKLSKKMKSLKGERSLHNIRSGFGILSRKKQT